MRQRSQIQVVVFAAFLCCLLGRAQAAAQACHAPSLRGAEGSSLRINLGSTAASYTNAQYSGEYQGAHGLVAFSHPWFFVDAALPYYRLVRNGLTVHGVGDVAADLRVTAWRWPSLALGVELAGTLPTGDATRSLGMGHVMLMPGAFMTATAERLTLVAQLSFGRALGHATGRHVHGGVGPIVNPMNRSELEHAFGAAYAFTTQLRATARVLGAVPVDDAHGRSREVVAAGLQLVLGAADLSVEQHLAVLGSPFVAKTVLCLGAQW